MKSPGIYCIRNTVNGKVYVGRSVDTWRRWRHHRSDLRNGTHSNTYLQRAWAKDGEAAFVFEVLESVLDPALLPEREGYFCTILGSFDRMRGYNLDAIDLSGAIVTSEETCRKRSVNRLGKKDSDETRRRKSEGRRGIPMSAETKKKLSEVCLGRKPSAETLCKLSEIRRGKTRSPEVGQRIAAALRGKHRTAEQIQQMSAVRVGKPGHPHTEESRRKIGDAHRGKILSAETRRRISETKKARRLALLAAEG